MTQEQLRTVPISHERGKRYVELFHRHHGAPSQIRFAHAVIGTDGVVHGVSLVGRPVARFLDDGWTLEVNRLCTDGTPNACSALYGAARRAAKGLGYLKLITYIRSDEPGISLRASGWEYEESTGPHTWARPNRFRTDKTESIERQRWSVRLSQEKPVNLSWPVNPDAPVQEVLDFGLNPKTGEMVG